MIDSKSDELSALATKFNAAIRNLEINREYVSRFDMETHQNILNNHLGYMADKDINDQINDVLYKEFMYTDDVLPTGEPLAEIWRHDQYPDVI